jgi:hypothetical protein
MSSDDTYDTSYEASSEPSPGTVHAAASAAWKKVVESREVSKSDHDKLLSRNASTILERTESEVQLSGPSVPIASGGCDAPPSESSDDAASLYNADEEGVTEPCVAATQAEMEQIAEMEQMEEALQECEKEDDSAKQPRATVIMASCVPSQLLKS